MLDLLLESILPIPIEPHPGLQPIWANEAMQRAFDIVQLVAFLEHEKPYKSLGSGAITSELRWAADLADTYRGLTTKTDRSRKPISHPLKVSVASIMGLFANESSAGNFSCECDSLDLDDVAARALVLTACRLLTSVLIESRTVRVRVEVRLTKIGHSAASLSIVGQSEALKWCDDTIDDLANILDAGVLRTYHGSGHVKVTLVFPHNEHGSVLSSPVDCEKVSGRRNPDAYGRDPPSVERSEEPGAEPYRSIRLISVHRGR